MTNEQSLKKLRKEISAFIEERDFERYHSPKNLAMALSVEASELLEIFQWLSEEESYHPDHQTKEHIAEEVSDIFIYLLTLSEKFDIDIISSAFAKLEKNKQKYPIAGR